MVEVTIQEVRNGLPTYKGLQDTQIETAIDIAKGILYGINEDWEQHPKAETCLLQQSLSQTLKLHFPHSEDSTRSLDLQVYEMLTSMWSSSSMVNKKTGFAKSINPTPVIDSDVKYRISKRR